MENKPSPKNIYTADFNSHLFYSLYKVSVKIEPRNAEPKPFFQESVKAGEKDSPDQDKKKRIADHNWKSLEKENKPTLLAPVFKGAAVERKKGIGSKML